jgi:hypothetical protein
VCPRVLTTTGASIGHGLDQYTKERCSFVAFAGLWLTDLKSLTTIGSSSTGVLTADQPTIAIARRIEECRSGDRQWSDPEMTTRSPDARADLGFHPRVWAIFSWQVECLLLHATSVPAKRRRKRSGSNR